MQSFEILGRQMPKCPPPWLRAWFVWYRSEDPKLFHVVSYSSNELGLVDDWANTFSRLYILKRLCFFCKFSQNGMLSRRNNKTFCNCCMNSKFWVFGSVLFRFCSVSEKFFNRSRRLSLALIWKVTLEIQLFYALSSFFFSSVLKMLGWGWKRILYCRYRSERWSHPANKNTFPILFEADMQIMGTVNKFSHVLRWLAI